VILREVGLGDLPVIFEHQRDPEAARMAAFTPRELPAFMEHWKTKILGEPTACARAVVEGTQVAGFVVTWTQADRRLLGYWIGRAFWGRGLATAALAEFVARVEPIRPLEASVATSNVGSIRVLQKCGFELVPGSRVIGDDGIEEVCYRRAA
jgi:RimJ/RimL family protein N-acetyltransferase